MTFIDYGVCLSLLLAIKAAFISMVINIVYLSQVYIWNPTKKQEIVELEMMQRRFIKRIEGMEHLAYPEQLKKLKLYSLERRRERYLVIYL